MSAPVYVRFSWEGAEAGGVQLDGSSSPGVGALQKFPCSPQLVSATFQWGNSQQWGSPWDRVGIVSPTSSVQGLIGHNRRFFPAPAPSSFPQRAEPREVVWRGRLGLEDADTHSPEKLAWKIPTGGQRTPQGTSTHSLVHSLMHSFIQHTFPD